MNSIKTIFVFITAHTQCKHTFDKAIQILHVPYTNKNVNSCFQAQINCLIIRSSIMIETKSYFSVTQHLKDISCKKGNSNISVFIIISSF